jgi:hypothetical protein
MNKWTRELVDEMAEDIVDRLGIEKKRCFLYFMLFMFVNDIVLILALILVMKLL